MIQSLHIQNFQSHKDTTLEFTPGVNVIVGSSDNGKTALIRALRWLVWNRPQGDAFRSWWDGDVVVEVGTDTDVVIRSKDKIDHYQLNNGKPFEAFKTEVPKEISDSLNLTEINLQLQLDSPFLLSDSPGEVAQHFNRVARLDKIDSAVQNVTKWIRELTQVIGFKQTEETRLKESLESFSYLPKFEVDVEVLEEMEQQWKIKNNQYKELRELALDIVDNNTLIEKESEILKILPLLDKILTWIETKKELVKEETRLQELVYDIEMFSDKQKDLQQLLSIEKPISDVLTLIETRKTALLTFTPLKNQLSSLSNIKYLLDTESRNLTRLNKEFITEMGDVCLLCGQSIKNKIK